ncbi:DUF6477 family protein [Ketogulonicigenium vulgare]|uniref:Uncharacterized protein n=1 Tax=Ketogulonicigenium vulgare (strain WSH-001) TaxID=759362 RepID=F9Y6Z4_KETVW|nr:DUF6477 family protein [Ketogulonicigenium vulgare]ADO42826.1 conserved hypothetical protein [Ketogulonicigenium vulgare Y25]AEM41011.1 hypothetical protein KVU_1172 [Ketogulonicigenium vulgare WSH-001]ALJ81162.1 hypothetical protein KVH_08205 [Ketogulonicigenium vulgare]ANW33909.1 hypothetical protein KvSKV_08175 [Ketogulonicigenium vulgare]AOZ54738.1 hypothetical protein KVC_1725 [Ketogulonicigenium vulgare]
MTHPALTDLRRPRLLVNAARFALEDYNRTVMLPRLLHLLRLPAPGHALEALIETEAEVNATRLTGSATYSIPEHIALLAALLAEAHICDATARITAQNPLERPADAA